MKTLAGDIVPAAVIMRGKSFGTVSAASITALYPAMFACDESASMGCALLMRGISSIANTVALREASLFTVSRLARGERNEMMVAPSLTREASSGVMGVTFRTTSDCA